MSSLESESLLSYYDRELTYLRRMGAEFARTYPKVARRLELGEHECPDPYVERLLEGVAFLTARVQQNIDREMPEVATGLLETLYPHYLAPVPSMAIAHFEPDRTQGSLAGGYTIARGTPLYADSHQGHQVRFRTSYPVTLWPIEVEQVAIERIEDLELAGAPPRAVAALRVRLRFFAEAPETTTIPRLRFYLDGHDRIVHELYQLALSGAVGAAVAPVGGGPARFLPADALRPVGFDASEAMLPYRNNAHPQYRLLQEYFCFHEKYLFIDVDTPGLEATSRAWDLVVFLDRMPRERLALTRSSMVLGCTPIVNLFNRTSEPIRLSHTESEYRLVADHRRHDTTEIHSIESVSSSSDERSESERIAPFFSFDHETVDRGGSFWSARRERSELQSHGGSEMWLSIVDVDFRPHQPASRTLFAHTLCTNRHLADQLPAGARLELEERAPVLGIHCLNKPTPQIDHPLSGATLWKLVSHLTVNHLSLSSDPKSLRALQGILELYSIFEDSSHRHQISGLREMTCERVTRRVGRDAWRGFCQGTAITLTFDDEKYVGSSWFLLASVLNRFFPLYSSINSFTQLTARSSRKDGLVMQWPAMVGEQIVL